MKATEKYRKAVDSVMKEFASQSDETKFFAPAVALGQIMGIKKVLEAEYSSEIDDERKNEYEMVQKYIEEKRSEVTERSK